MRIENARKRKQGRGHRVRPALAAVAAALRRREKEKRRRWKGGAFTRRGRHRRGLGFRTEGRRMEAEIFGEREEEEDDEGEEEMGGEVG